MSRTSAEQWPDRPPALSGHLDQDMTLLEAYTTSGDAVLSALPPKSQRATQQQLTAAEVHAGCRRLRASFMSLHAEAVYQLLTRDGTDRPRLDALAVTASAAFPGLVPTPGQLATEHCLIQAEREGREIDQGIFFGAVLASPAAGTHLLKSMLRPTDRSLKLLDEFRATGEADLGAARIRRVEHAAHVTIHNGHCLNAEDNELVDALETAIDLALLDPEVTAGVVRGAVMTHPRYAGRRVFSAGINLKHLSQGRISFVDFLLRREAGFISKLLRGLLVDDGEGGTEAVEKPWLAAVDAFAIGGGAQLLLVFDRVLAASDSYFSLPAANEGIVPGVSNLRLSRLAGGRLARQVILWGRRIYAGEPESRLVFDEIVEPSDMDEAVERSLRQLASPAVAANRHMLIHSEEPLDMFREYLAEFSPRQAVRLYSADVIEKTSRV